MDVARWERFAPLTGIVAVVLWVISEIIGQSTEILEKDTALEVLVVFKDDTNALIASGLIFALGVVFFIWFLGSLRARMWRAEGGLGRLTALAYGSGMLAALCLLFQAAPIVQGAIDEEDLSPGAAQSLQMISEAFFGGTEITLIPMFIAVGLLTLRTPVFPKWLGWVSLVIALVLVIIPIGWAGVVFLFPLWTIVTSVILFTKPPPPPGPPPLTVGFVGTEQGPPEGAPGP
jgi:hypothetical protein